MSGIGVIINPHSRHHRGNRRGAVRLARIVGDSGVVAECGSVDELYRTAEDFRRQAVSILAIGGGDGTNSVTTTGFYRVYGGEPLPRLALLRGGTMNTVANSVGVPQGRPDTLLSLLVDSYVRGEEMKFTERTTMDVGGKLGFLFGTGIVYGFLAEYYAAGRPYPTPWTAVKTLARGSASALVGGEMVRRMAARVDAELRVDGELWPMRRYLSVAAGTVDQIGLGFRPFYRAYERGDAFHLLGIHATPAGLVGRLPRVYRAQPMGAEHVTEALACAATLRVRSGVVQYMIDGDLHETVGALRITAGPRVRILSGSTGPLKGPLDVRSQASWRPAAAA